MAGFFFFFFSFTGSLTPAYGEENLVTSFGSGPTNVRLYTDYLCRPCKAAEPEVEALLAALVNKNAICLTFIDTPVHKETIFYAKYFLYALQSDRSFLRALAIRSALFEAAEQKIVAPPAMESFLTKKGIKYILDNPEQAREMGRAGRKLVEERYDWKVIGEKLEKLI